MKNKKRLFCVLSFILALLMTAMSIVGCGDDNPSKTEEDLYLNNPNRGALQQVLNGKTLSILGDSISTFGGVSNATSVNDTLGTNDVYYWDGSYNDAELSWWLPINLNQTWWKQTADYANMRVLVNNSNSGSSVTDIRTNRVPGYIRCNQLHSNVGEVENPDIIAVFMGTNDYLSNCPCDESVNSSVYQMVKEDGFTPRATNFVEACTFMFDQIATKYQNAKVFVFTLPQMSEPNHTSRRNINKILGELATHYGAEMVQLADTALDDYNKYTADGIHPNTKGMDIMTEQFIKALERVYLPIA